jgi:hypothetical protein
MARAPGIVFLALVVALAAPGCTASTYKISQGELARLAATSPATRGQSVAVRQQAPWDDEPPAAQPIGADAQLIIIGPNIEIGGGGRGGRGSGGGGGGGGGGKNAPKAGEGADAKATAIAIVVIAVTAVVVMAVVEGQRWAGHVQLNPMHPVHLFLKDGNYAVVPLAQIDPQLAAYTDTAMVRASEGPWYTLDREPLDRRGLSYTVLLGVTQSVSADGRLGTGPTAHIQLGYFMSQQLGILADLVFGWRQNRVNATLFDTRASLEAQYWPVALGPVHGGVFGDIGVAQRIEDGIPGGNSSGVAFSGGAQLQLDLTTFLGLTARFGVTHAHDDLVKEVLVGLSVY